MAKKLKISLSVKLTLIVVLVSAVFVFSLTFFNIHNQTNVLTTNYVEQGISLAKSFDASIGFHNILYQNQTLQYYVENISKENKEITQLSLSVFYAEGLQIIASTNQSLIGMSADSNNTFSYLHNMVGFYPSTVAKSHFMTVIVPMNISTHVVGTYEIRFSLDRAYAVFDVQMRNLLAFSIFSLFVLIFVSLYLLRRTIVKPIIMFRNATKLIGTGDLESDIEIRSRDELGELAAAFNAMSEDLRRSRQKIQHYNKTLEELLDKKDEFITQLGHDLKSPLTPLVGLLPLVSEKIQDPEIQKHLKIILRNVEYMRDLVLKTLELAKLRSPNTALDFEALDLHDVVHEAVEYQQHVMKKGNIQVINNISKNIRVYADRLRVLELLNNLLTNAVKYTPAAGGTVTLNAIQDSDFVTISVQDTGIGMTPDQVDEVFDEFFTATQSRKQVDSSGLGLSICKRIVEKHGGTIWAESKGLGKGSTFFFTLPLDNKKY